MAYCEYISQLDMHGYCGTSSSNRTVQQGLGEVTAVALTLQLDPQFLIHNMMLKFIKPIEILLRNEVHLIRKS